MSVLSNAYVSINAVNLSSAVRAVTLSPSIDEVENTVMGTANTKTVEGGLLGWNIAVTFKQGFGGGSVHETLAAAHGTVVAIEVRPVNTTVSATNPKFTGNGLVKYTQPWAGSVGALMEAQCEIVAAGAGTWGTS